MNPSRSAPGMSSTPSAQSHIRGYRSGGPQSSPSAGLPKSVDADAAAAARTARTGVSPKAARLAGTGGYVYSPASRHIAPRAHSHLTSSAAVAAFAFPISDIEVFHTDRGSEFDNAEIDLMLEAFGIERSLSAKGCPYDNAVDESTNRILKAELVHRETFGTTRELRAKLSDYVHWYNNFRIHSTLGYMSPVEFREAGLSLPESSK